MGSRTAKFLLEKEGVEIVGAIDIAKDKVGKDLGEVLQLGKRLGVVVTNNCKKIFYYTAPPFQSNSLTKLEMKKKENGIKTILHTYYDKKRNTNFSRSNDLIKSVHKYVLLSKKNFDEVPLE